MEIGKLLKDVKGFDWDKGNREKNWERHGVNFRECEEMFSSKPLLFNFDKEHSERETRFQVLGQTDEKRRLFAVFTIRGKKIRIISARDQNRKERNKYEKTKTDSTI